jgi:hypothetical protein
VALAVCGGRMGGGSYGDTDNTKVRAAPKELTQLQDLQRWPCYSTLLVVYYCWIYTSDFSYTTAVYTSEYACVYMRTCVHAPAVGAVAAGAVAGVRQQRRRQRLLHET